MNPHCVNCQYPCVIKCTCDSGKVYRVSLGMPLDSNAGFIPAVVTEPCPICKGAAVVQCVYAAKTGANR